jgi:Zn-dependent oligopeptidase
MLENWCFEKTVLKKISRHYQTSNPLPDTTIDSIIKRWVFMINGSIG